MTEDRKMNTACKNKMLWQEYEKRMNEKFWKEVNAEIREKETKRVAEIIKKSGIEKALNGKTFDNFKISEEWQNDCMNMMKSWVNQEELKGSVMLCGQSGAGKTHLCTAAARELMHKGHEVKYLLWVQESKPMMMFNEFAMEMRKKACEAEVLYIDDLFKGTPTNADVKLTFEIIDYRYRQEKPTIISTELLPYELEHVDGAVYGRIREMCKGNIKSISRERQRNRRLKNEQKKIQEKED